MCAFHVIECTAADIRKVESELYFTRNLRTCLFVPGITMPTVKVSPGWQRFPALCLIQFEIMSQVSRKQLLSERVQRQVNEALIQNQNVLNHVAIGFGFLVPVKIIPAQPSQLALECNLHATELFFGKQIRQNHNTFCVECVEVTINSR